MNEDHRETCRDRAADCKLESYIINKRLKLFSLTNWITIIVPTLLAVAAGSAIFAGEAWKWEIGGMILVGGLLTAIHKGLDCDAYQSECRRLIRAYDGLAFRYQSLHEVNREDWQSELLALEEQLANLKENTTARISVEYRDKIKKLFEQGAI